jgi:hypothetical protein
MKVRFSAPVQTGPGAHPASCTMGTGSFPGAKSGRGVTLSHHPLLVPRSRKGRAIPLLPLWAVRPVQSLSACTRVHFTLHFYLQLLYIKHKNRRFFGYITYLTSVSQIPRLYGIKLQGNYRKWIGTHAKGSDCNQSKLVVSHFQEELIDSLWDFRNTRQEPSSITVCC